MGINERDFHTGHATTGHEWNGITELNTAVPKPVWLALIVTVIFSVVYWVLMPTWPVGRTYTKGLLGLDTREQVALSLREAAEQRSEWASRLESEDFAQIMADQTLVTHVRQTGKALFGDNCAACHGANGSGGPGFPSLADREWLWGGTPEDIFETIRVGINSSHPDTRIAAMPAFGRDGMLDRNSILAVIAYVRSLSQGPSTEQAEQIAAGKEIFAANCASCHGEDAKGDTEFGAPDLTDDYWMHGGDLESIYRTVWHGQGGLMPSWEDKLSPSDRKILALYVLDLNQRPQ